MPSNDNIICYVQTLFFFCRQNLAKYNINDLLIWLFYQDIQMALRVSRYLEYSEGVKTDQGKIRAWIRLTTNESTLQSYFQLISDEGIAKKYYESYALLNDMQMVTKIIGLISKVTERGCKVLFNPESFDNENAPSATDMSQFTGEVVDTSEGSTSTLAPSPDIPTEPDLVQQTTSQQSLQSEESFRTVLEGVNQDTEDHRTSSVDVLDLSGSSPVDDLERSLSEEKAALECAEEVGESIMKSILESEETIPIVEVTIPLEKETAPMVEEKTVPLVEKETMVEKEEVPLALEEECSGDDDGVSVEEDGALDAICESVAASVVNEVVDEVAAERWTVSGDLTTGEVEQTAGDDNLSTGNLVVADNDETGGNAAVTSGNDACDNPTFEVEPEGNPEVINSPLPGKSRL
eukprot:sb/3465276/